MAVQGKIKVTYVDQPKCRFVCFNSDILAITKRFKINSNGMLVGNMYGWTVKDFRKVDKTIYFFPGKVSEEDVQTLIGMYLSLIHISEPTRQAEISYAVFC